MALLVSKALRKARSHVRRGRLTEAEAIYKEILSRFPQSRYAIEDYNTLKALLSAENSESPGIDPSPPQIQTLSNLLNQGKLQEVIEHIESLAASFPESAILFQLSGIAFAGMDRLDEAYNSFRAVISVQPNNAAAYNNLGLVQKRKGEITAAIDSCTVALQLNPTYLDAHINLANMRVESGDYKAAVRCFRQAIELNPSIADVYSGLGICQDNEGDLDSAIDSLEKAIQLDPDNDQYYNNLGVVLKNGHELDRAVECYKKAISIDPSFSGSHSNLGVALCELGQYEAGIESFKKSLEFDGNNGWVLGNIGAAYKSRDQLELALDYFKQAIDVESYKIALGDPYPYPAAQVEKMHLHAQFCAWSELYKDPDIAQTLGLAKDEVECFFMFSMDDSPSRQLARAALYANNRFKFQPLPLHAEADKKEHRLRIGYFSPDFREHPVTNLIARVLELHDRDNFEIYAYSFGGENCGNKRERLENAVDVFKDVSELSAREICMQARADKIDIAIDLAGSTNNCRTAIFAYRAAPIQINYLGFPGTMGAEFMDYIIGDATVVPDESGKHYRENVIRLPNAYMPTDNTREVPSAAVRRSEIGLPEASFVFCAFNQGYKITPREFDIWMRLLLQVDGSVLWLRSWYPQAKKNLCLEAEARGVDSSRLIFAETAVGTKHLARLKSADLFLDTFSFNAHSTAIDALWAGLPVVTKLGESFAARVAGSLLAALGMQELVVTSEGAYEALALDLAKNPARLAGINRALSANLLTTPLFDSEQFTKHLESGYQQAYKRYSDGQEPADIQVPQ